MPKPPQPFHHVDIIVGQDPPPRPAQPAATVRHEFAPVEVRHKIDKPVRSGMAFGFGFMAGRTLYRLLMVLIVYGVVLLLGFKLFGALGL